VAQYHNLIVDLDERFDARAMPAHRRALDAAGFDVRLSESADERTLAWMDLVFGGTWSSEAYAASNVLLTRDDAPVGFATFDPRERTFAWLRALGAQPGVGVFGPFGVDPSVRGHQLGPALLALALGELRSRGYARALIAAVGEEGLLDYYARTVGARIAESYDPYAFGSNPTRTVVLASGSGSNFQAVIDAVQKGLPLKIDALVCNKANAFALDRAKRAKIESVLLPWQREAQTRDEYDRALLEAVREKQPQLVLLLGWMHLLDREFVDAFPNLLNVHPAYLPHDPARNDVGLPDGTFIPAYRGARAVRDALADNSPWVGASVHGVTLDTDRGPVLARMPVPVEGESEDDVLARLHPVEHKTLITAIRRWLFER
jgi:phosphoribosylglycinamide formyltransferase-1